MEVSGGTFTDFSGLLFVKRLCELHNKQTIKGADTRITSIKESSKDGLSAPKNS